MNYQNTKLVKTEQYLIVASRYYCSTLKCTHKPLDECHYVTSLEGSLLSRTKVITHTKQQEVFGKKDDFLIQLQMNIENRPDV